jgi:hypothetical protein
MHSVLVELPNTLPANIGNSSWLETYTATTPLSAPYSTSQIQQKTYVFLGDYADRGISGTEVLEGVSRLLDRNRENVVLLKGNHEDYTENGET